MWTKSLPDMANVQMQETSKNLLDTNSKGENEKKNKKKNNEIANTFNNYCFPAQ